MTLLFVFIHEQKRKVIESINSLEENFLLERPGAQASCLHVFLE